MRIAWMTVLLLASGPVAGPGPDGRWLDGGLVQWNAAGAAVPAPPQAPAGDDAFAHAQRRCASLLKVAETASERAVAAAGWKLREGGTSSRGRIELVTGFAAFGSQCRSASAQVFAFADGKFAGTLSPHPMDQRTDGGLVATQIHEDGRVDALYARYLDPRSACCPTSHARARFGVVTDERGVPRLVWSSLEEIAEP